MAKVTQINLHHSKAASAALILRLGERGDDIALVQEPWTHNGKILGLNALGYKLLFVNNAGKPRSCILAKKHLKIFTLYNYSDDDTVTVACEFNGITIWLVSSYMAHDHQDPPPNCRVTNAVRDAAAKRIPIIIGADANAHHLFWGSSDTNSRGEYIAEFILEFNMSILNRGSEPTFVVANRQEVLDITLISADHAYLVRDWKVSTDCSFSDHRYLEFSIDRDSGSMTPFLNRKKTDWELQGRILRDLLPFTPPPILGVSDIDEAVGKLTTAFREATMRSCRPSLGRMGSKPPWWSVAIQESRKRCRKLFNEAKRTGNWSLYKTSLNHFKNEVRNAKRKSWRRYCDGIASSSETSRLRKILSKTPSVPGFIQKSDGSWTNSSDESLETLMDTHFPGCLPVTIESSTSTYLLNDISGSVEIDQDKLRWAIGSFQPFKSPGQDGIIPADMRNNIEFVIPWLLNIYRACLSWSYVPELWTKYNVRFIPKGGRTSHAKAKDFRPISLSSFLLKALERLVDMHIRMSVDKNLLSSSQHAYTKGKSVETALHSLVGYIERSLEFKNNTLVAFLDIEGAFNNVEPAFIGLAMEELGIDRVTRGFILNLLARRTISSNYGMSNLTRTVARGTPQGGVLSPLIWNITINMLLRKLDSLGYKTVAYADDVAVAVSGVHPGTLSERMELALRTLSRWCGDSGLSVNPMKTDLVLFTNRNKLPVFRLPTLNGVELTLSSNAKYLGIILDSKLSWGLNIEARVGKAMSAIYVCRKTIGTTWGINPKNVHWLWEAVIRPTLFYGVTVWWTATKKAVNRQRLERVLRSMALLITGAIRSTPSKSLFALLNFLPVDLQAEKIALETAIRLDATGRWNHRSWGHAAILGSRVDFPDLIDYCIPNPFFSRKFHFSISDNPRPEGGSSSWRNFDVYTDGSKRRMGVGGGVYIEELGVRMTFRLPDECSILQAEIAAIKRAANWLRYYRIFRRNIRIFTDSQAAIRSLVGVYTTSTLVQECRTSLNKMAEHSTVVLIWVRGHGTTLPGNNTADELARRGATLGDADIDVFCGVPLLACKKRIETALGTIAQTRWLNESSCRIARLLWPRMERERTLHLLRLGRTQLRDVVAVLTGHCRFGTHARRMGIPYNDFCRSCLDEEEEESIEHLICFCPALAELRCLYLGRSFLPGLSSASSLEIKGLYSFIRGSGWVSRLTPTGVDAH